jgi:predicted Zn-dependent peptidase
MRDGKRVVFSPRLVEKAETLDLYDGAVLHSSIMLGFQVPFMQDTDVYGTLVLKEYLENHIMETDRTAENNQEHEALNLRIISEYRSFLTGGSFAVLATVRAGEEARGVENLRSKVARIVAQPLRYADFHAARTLAAGLYMFGNQTRRAQIENLTKNLLAGRNLQAYQNFFRNIEQVDEEDFRELMRRVLDMNKAVTVVVYGGDR